MSLDDVAVHGFDRLQSADVVAVAPSGSIDTPACCTSTTSPSTPRPAPPPASTCACTWGVRNRAPPSPTPSPGAWSCRRAATAARPSTSRRRTFARRFRAVAGTTPYAWVLRQRVLAAQRLIEERADLSMEDVAGLVGFGSAALLRQHFVRELGTAPSSYRQAFTRRAG